MRQATQDIQNAKPVLQHRLVGSGVKAVLLKPGPTDTPMTASLKDQGVVKLAPVEDVAAGSCWPLKKVSLCLYAKKMVAHYDGPSAFAQICF